MKISQEKMYNLSSIGHTKYFKGLSKEEKNKHLNAISKLKLKKFYAENPDGGITWDWWKILRYIKLFLSIISAIVKSNETNFSKLN